MNRTRLWLLTSIAFILLLAASCKVDPPYAAVSEADLLRMPSFQATVHRTENGNIAVGGNLVDANWFAAYFTTADGKWIVIGGPNASADMIAFVRTLRKGQTCALPDAFITFQKSRAGKN